MRCLRRSASAFWAKLSSRSKETGSRASSNCDFEASVILKTSTLGQDAQSCSMGKLHQQQQWTGGGASSRADVAHVMKTCCCRLHSKSLGRNVCEGLSSLSKRMGSGGGNSSGLIPSHLIYLQTSWQSGTPCKTSVLKCLQLSRKEVAEVRGLGSNGYVDSVLPTLKFDGSRDGIHGCCAMLCCTPASYKLLYLTWLRT